MEDGANARAPVPMQETQMKLLVSGFRLVQLPAIVAIEVSLSVYVCVTLPFN